MTCGIRAPLKNSGGARFMPSSGGGGVSLFNPSLDRSFLSEMSTVDGTLSPLWRSRFGIGSSSPLAVIAEEAAQQGMSLTQMEEGDAAAAAAAMEKAVQVCYCSDHSFHELRGKAHTHLTRTDNSVLPVLLYLCCLLLALLLIHSLVMSAPLSPSESSSAMMAEDGSYSSASSSSSSSVLITLSAALHTAHSVVAHAIGAVWDSVVAVAAFATGRTRTTW